MEWPKIKNIIIFILLGANLCLLVITLGQKIDARQEAQAREKAIAFLRQSGIDLEEEVVPKSMSLQVLRVQRSMEGEAEFARKLLGAAQTRELGGDIFRYYNEKGYIQFHNNGELQAFFEPGAFPLEGAAPQAHAVDLMEALGYEGELVPEKSELDGNQNVKITMRQSYEGVPVLSYEITLVYRNGYLSAITDAKRLFGQPQAETGAEPMTVTTALIKFRVAASDQEGIFSEIKQITPSYAPSGIVSGVIRLAPVWYIETNTGAYQLDLLDGTVSAVS